MAGLQIGFLHLCLYGSTENMMSNHLKNAVQNHPRINAGYTTCTDLLMIVLDILH